MARWRWGVLVPGLVALVTAARPARAGANDPPHSGALPDLPAAPPAPAGATPAPPGAGATPPADAPGGSAPDQQKKKAPATPPPAPAPPPGSAPAAGAPPGAYPPGAYPPGAYPPGAYPPGYPAPYPYPGGYPPPYYPYPPPYYPYPPPPEEPAKQLPVDASVRGSPFVDGLITGAFFENRFESAVNVGVQVGMYAGGRVRLTARLLAYTDTSSSSTNYDASNPYYYPTSSQHPTILWGASAGYALVAGRSFALSPGLVFMGADKSNGYFLGLGLPFDWVLSSGLRIGFEVAYGRAFGGTYEASCNSTTCPQGTTAEFDRPAGTGLLLQFALGFGFNHPDPE